MNPTNEEVRIFCDNETNTALVRIFKLRNYLISGGKTFEIKKNSQIIKMLAKICGLDDIWDTSSETAKTYQVKEKKNDTLV